MNLKPHCLALALLLAGLPSLGYTAQAAPAAGAQAQQPVTILTSLPITYGLGEMLLKGTDVQLHRAAPANLPGTRQVSFFSGRGAAGLQKLAVKADAVIGLRSIWSDDPLYPMARRSNIRIVEIDAARPVDGALPGIATQSDSRAADGLSGQPWLAINNMGRMADVVAADLVRLAPNAKPQVESNLAAFKQQLLKLNADSEAALARADNLTVVSLSDRFDYLISGLNLDRLDVELPANNDWSADALQALTETLKEDDVAIVLLHQAASAELAAAITAGGSQAVVLENDDSAPLASLETVIGQILKALGNS
ncbi:MAG: metal ABC transporter solute-binding protein, Zn/Mn family [Pseudomonas sp.]|uniref:metal ABC transporter solute-binding protein, Zn/Mn family n=1 Tax=Pseudomonas sp. TaxID=306 RepID=UPI003D133889